LSSSFVVFLFVPISFRFIQSPKTRHASFSINSRRTGDIKVLKILHCVWQQIRSTKLTYKCESLPALQHRHNSAYLTEKNTHLCHEKKKFIPLRKNKLRLSPYICLVFRHYNHLIYVEYNMYHFSFPFIIDN